MEYTGVMWWIEGEVLKYWRISGDNNVIIYTRVSGVEGIFTPATLQKPYRPPFPWHVLNKPTLPQ